MSKKETAEAFPFNLSAFEVWVKLEHEVQFNIQGILVALMLFSFQIEVLNSTNDVLSEGVVSAYHVALEAFVVAILNEVNKSFISKVCAINGKNFVIYLTGC